MPDYTPQTKRSARTAQRAAEWTRSACGGLGIEGNPRYLYAAFFFDLLAQVSRSIADDPARKDFTVSTRVRPHFATPQYVSAGDPADRVLLDTAQAADSAESYLAAHLRAFERMQGALKAERRPEAQRRAQEAKEHARSSSRTLDVLARHMEELAAIQRDEREREPREGRPQLSDVSHESLAVLFLGGLRIRDLKRVLVGTRLEEIAIATERIEEASATLASFGAEMANWSPPADSDIPLQSPSS